MGDRAGSGRRKGDGNRRRNEQEDDEEVEKLEREKGCEWYLYAETTATPAALNCSRLPEGPGALGLHWSVRRDIIVRGDRPRAQYCLFPSQSALIAGLGATAMRTTVARVNLLLINRYHI